MAEFTVDTLLAAVTKAYTDKADDPRFAEIITGLLEHLHGFVKDVELTEQEWMQGIEFLTDTGHMCDDKRQEFILLSDTLGVSMLVDALNHPKSGLGTDSTVLGPFFVDGAPERPYGDNIVDRDIGGALALVRGRVTDPDGSPVADAIIDVWQTAANRLYDVQDETAPEWNLRCKFRSRADGTFAFVTEKPTSYAVPTDGPVGRLLRAGGRHAMRPAHIHFVINADGYDQLTTHLFVSGDENLESDAVFAVKDDLIIDFPNCDDKVLAEEFKIDREFALIDFDFGLMPVTEKAAAA